MSRSIDSYIKNLDSIDTLCLTEIRHLEERNAYLLCQLRLYRELVDKMVAELKNANLYKEEFDPKKAILEL